jgi:hypothetical protein
MSLTGTYRITSSGSLIGEYQNSITTNGLLAINQYLAGLTPSWAGSLAVGTLYTNPTASTSVQLDYEFKRYPITLKSYRTVSSSVHQIALKVTIDPEATFQAYELGVFPAIVQDSSYTDHYPISDFSEQLSGSSAWYISGVPATTSSSARIGALSLALPAGSTASSTVSVNTSTYTEADSLKILFYSSTTITSGSFIVNFGDDSLVTNLWTASGTFSSTTAGNYYSASVGLSTKPALFSNSVVSASINYAGTGAVRLDHMKWTTGETKTTDFKLVSRTASATPLFTKTYGQPMEIEYYLEVT